MKILFVEDDAMNRRVVRDMLDVAGAAMVGADSAETGLQRIDEGEYDLVLLDLRMPGMDGFEVIRRVRARDDAKRTLPIIVVTADAALDLTERCIAAGADEVLFKPVAMDALFDAIGRIVANRAGGDLLF